MNDLKTNIANIEASLEFLPADKPIAYDVGINGIEVNNMHSGLTDDELLEEEIANDRTAEEAEDNQRFVRVACDLCPKWAYAPRTSLIHMGWQLLPREVFCPNHED